VRVALARWCLPTIALLALAGQAVAGEPLTLRYAPEQGLSVKYDVKIEADLQIRGGGASQSQALKLEGTLLETVKSVSGGRVVVTRQFTRLVAVAGGRSENAPSDVTNQVQTFTYNDRGELLNSSSSSAAEAGPGMPNPVDFVAAGLVRIPYAQAPVVLGDKWDASSGLRIMDDALSVDAEATLVGIYESAGMQVALTDTTLAASGTTQGGADAPSTTFTVKGGILQSTRIEDGAILGMRARMSVTSRFTMGGMGSLEIVIDDLKMEVAVAG